jgi:hypothetical protein
MRPRGVLILKEGKAREGTYHWELLVSFHPLSDVQEADHVLTLLVFDFLFDVAAIFNYTCIVYRMYKRFTHKEVTTTRSW